MRRELRGDTPYYTPCYTPYYTPDYTPYNTTVHAQVCVWHTGTTFCYTPDLQQKIISDYAWFVCETKDISALMVSCLLGKRSLPKLALFQMRPSLQKIPISETCFGKEARYTRLFSKKNYYRSGSVCSSTWHSWLGHLPGDLFLGPLEWARAETGRADWGVLSRKGFAGFTRVNKVTPISPPCPGETHYQFSM